MFLKFECFRQKRRILFCFLYEQLEILAILFVLKFLSTTSGFKGFTATKVIPLIEFNF